MADLFGNSNEILRTIGLYQPYASLMLHGKVETRWVRKGKKPPFPLGKYLIYSTQKAATEDEICDWSGHGEVMEFLSDTIRQEITVNMRGYGLAIADLVKIEPMARNQEMGCFVKYKGEKQKRVNGKLITYTQWCLYFRNVHRITPFEFKHGKQGVGLFPELEKHLITHQ